MSLGALREHVLALSSFQKHNAVMDTQDATVTVGPLGETSPIACAVASDLFAVPPTLEASLAPARWCVFEWTDYTVTFPGADRLRVGSTLLSPIPGTGGIFQLRFANQLGLTRITPHRGGVQSAPALHVEVLARKFAHPAQSVDFLVALLSDIFARQASLAFSAVAMTERRVRESHRSPNPLFTYHFFRHHSAELIRALQAILGRPHQRLTDESVMVRLHQVRTLERESIVRLLTSGRGSEGARTVPSTAPVLERLRPDRVYQRLPDETFDTPENRFVVMAARRMTLALDHLLRSQWMVKINIDRKDRLPFDRAREQLGMLTTDSRLAALPHMQVYPVQSRVLQRRDGYRELAQLWNLFQRASQPMFEHLQRAIDLRNVAELYELWVWFELIDRIRAQSGIDPVIRPSRSALGHPDRGQTARFGDLGTLHYNRTFSGITDVYSGTTLRSDYVWDRADGRRIVLDAKFRMSQLADLIDAGDGEWAVTAKATSGDILTMHAYRDAIAGVTAAIVLYPGSQTRFWRSNGMSTMDLSIADVIAGDLDAVGAIPLRPTTAHAQLPVEKEERP